MKADEKQNGLLLFSFIFPNRDFSMGYTRFKQKNLSPIPTRPSVVLKSTFARRSFRPSPVRARDVG
jgi:hypothetical protein